MPRTRTTTNVEAAGDCESIRFTRNGKGWVESVELVFADGRTRPLPMPVSDGPHGRPMSDGFEWGYGGQGPWALAYALVGLIARRLHVPGLEAALRDEGYRVGEFMRYVATMQRETFVLSRADLAFYVETCRRDPSEVPARVVDLVLTFESGPDGYGRRSFTLEWVDPDGDFRTHPHPKDGEPVGHRRGQCFNAVPTDYVARVIDRGGRIVDEVRS